MPEKKPSDGATAATGAAAPKRQKREEESDDESSGGSNGDGGSITKSSLDPSARLSLRKEKKSAREKARRQRENALFDELASMCNVPSDTRDKSSVLKAVIKRVEELRTRGGGGHHGLLSTSSSSSFSSNGTMGGAIEFMGAPASRGSATKPGDNLPDDMYIRQGGGWALPAPSFSQQQAAPSMFSGFPSLAAQNAYAMPGTAGGYPFPMNSPLNATGSSLPMFPHPAPIGMFAIPSMHKLSTVAGGGAPVVPHQTATPPQQTDAYASGTTRSPPHQSSGQENGSRTYGES